MLGTGVQPQEPPQLHPHAAAQLKGRPFPSGGTAEQVGENSADKNQGGCPEPQHLFRPDRGQDGIGAAVRFHACGLVHPGDEHPRQRQEPDDEAVPLPEMSGFLNQVMEGGPGHADGDAAEDGKPRPLEENPQAVGHFREKQRFAGM